MEKTNSDVFLTKRAERNKLLDNIRKQPIYHRLVMDLVDMSIADTREAYETTTPASEYLRGQLIALKELRKMLSDK